MAALELPLRQGLDQLGLALSDTQVRQLLDYLDLIQRWSRVYNLTALRSPAEMLTHHLLDSLAVVGPLGRLSDTHIYKDVLDVGAGAGLPGVVIAICRPDLRVDCVDAVAKKAAFIQQCAGTLKLPNLRGLHSRVEALEGRYGVVTSRAFASLADFVALTEGVLAEGGVWMAMKGKVPHEEIAQLGGLRSPSTANDPGLRRGDSVLVESPGQSPLPSRPATPCHPDESQGRWPPNSHPASPGQGASPSRITVFHVEQLTVPGLAAERCLVWMRRAESLT